MRYVASYLLAVLGGNASPSAADLEKIINSVGIEANKEGSERVIKELSGKNLEELIALGREKLSAVPSGGAAPVAAAAAAAPAAAAAEKKEEKKEEKKDETESEDEDMGFGLFD